MRHRLTIDLGPLYPRLQKHCDKTGQRPSDVVRSALAKLLGVKPPEMHGHVANLWQNAGKPHPRQGKKFTK